MKVEICYAEPARATRITIALPDGTTVGQAVAASGIVAFLALDPTGLTYAIFGRRATLDAPLAAGDRVELLRPLLVNPKDARHRRVAKKRAQSAKMPP